MLYPYTLKYIFCSLRRIRGFGDRAANDQVIGTFLDGFRWGKGTFLIVTAAAIRPDARHYEREIIAALLA